MDDLQVLQEQLSEWKSLQKHVAWLKLQAYVAAQLSWRTEQVMLDATFDEGKRNYIRGEYSGIKLFSRIPQIEIDQIEAELESLAKKEQEDATGRTD